MKTTYKMPNIQDFQYCITKSKGNPTLNITQVMLGSYGLVQLAKSKKTNQLIALKSLNYRIPQNCLQFLLAISHKNVVRVLGYFYDEKIMGTVLILEYPENGKFINYVKENNSKNRGWLYQFVNSTSNAVGYLNSLGIINLEINFDNVFVGNNGVVKFCGVVIESLYHCVGNFGMYMGMGKSCMEYYAPQILKKQSFTNKAYSWSFGILLYEYIQGVHPYFNPHTYTYPQKNPLNYPSIPPQNINPLQLLQLLKKPIAFSNKFKSQQIQFILRLLRQDPRQRPDLKQIIHISMTMLGLSKNKNGSCNTQNGIVTVNGSSNIVNNIGGNISLNRNQLAQKSKRTTADSETLDEELIKINNLNADFNIKMNMSNIGVEGNNGNGNGNGNQGVVIGGGSGDNCNNSIDSGNGNVNGNGNGIGNTKRNNQGKINDNHENINNNKNGCHNNSKNNKRNLEKLEKNSDKNDTISLSNSLQNTPQVIEQPRIKLNQKKIKILQTKNKINQNSSKKQKQQSGGVKTMEFKQPQISQVLSTSSNNQNKTHTGIQRAATVSGSVIQHKSNPGTTIPNQNPQTKIKLVQISEITPKQRQQIQKTRKNSNNLNIQITGVKNFNNHQEQSVSIFDKLRQEKKNYMVMKEKQKEKEKISLIKCLKKKDKVQYTSSYLE